MPAPFDLTEDATADLEAAVTYLAERSQTSALHLAGTLEDAFLLLSQHPHIGHRDIESAEIDDVRFWNAAGYLIAFLLDRKPIFMLAVLHGSRDAANIIPNRVEKYEPFRKPIHPGHRRRRIHP